MEKFDLDLIQADDQILILGSCGEPGIVHYSISKLWERTTLHRYGTNEIITHTSPDDESNLQLECRLSGSFYPKHKPGHVHVTIGSHGTKINVTEEDKEKYDYILEVKDFLIDQNKEGFAPYLLHKKR